MRKNAGLGQAHPQKQLAIKTCVNNDVMCRPILKLYPSMCLARSIDPCAKGAGVQLNLFGKVSTGAHVLYPNSKSGYKKFIDSCILLGEGEGRGRGGEWVRVNPNIVRIVMHIIINYGWSLK